MSNIGPSLVERYFRHYGVAITMGQLTSMMWHHFNRYRFHSTYYKDEEAYRDAGRPKDLLRELRLKWTVMREAELKKQFDLGTKLIVGTAIVSIVTKLVKMRKKTFRLSFNPYLPPICDTFLAFLLGGLLCVNAPYYLYHQREVEKIRKWKEAEERKRNRTEFGMDGGGSSPAGAGTATTSVAVL